MARTCTACAHPERGSIDQALVAGASARSIAGRFGLSEDAVARHRENHLPIMLAKAQEAAEAAQADTLLDQLRSLQRRTIRLLDQAERAGKLTPAVLAVGQARGNLELMAKLMHELDDRPQINLLVAPEWLAVRTVIIDALRPYPEAAIAVAAQLVQLEGVPL